MSGIITTGSIPRLLQEGVRDIFGNELKQHDSKYDKIFEVLNSNKAYEINVQMEGFSRANTKNEGDDIAFDSRRQGWTPKYVNSTVAKGFIVTQEALEDELYGQFRDGAKALAKSMSITRELDAASVLNNGFDSNYTMTDGDGSELFSTSHSNGPSGGTFSNKLSTDADLSEASLEDLLAQIMQTDDARGLPAALNAKRLVVAAGTNAFEAQRIYGSVLQNDTANNATNAIRDMNSIKDGWISSPYLTDQDAWFLTTDAPHGLKFYQRVGIEFGRDEAFTSGNERFKARQRYSYGWDDARGVFGTSGA
jgi:hypothetical protein